MFRLILRQYVKQDNKREHCMSGFLPCRNSSSSYRIKIAHRKGPEILKLYPVDAELDKKSQLAK